MNIRFRPIRLISIFTIIITIPYCLYYSSLSGGEGGMYAPFSIFITLLSIKLIAIESFLLKNSNATKKETLITESIILAIMILIACFIIFY